MATLQYDIALVGVSNVKKAFASMESMASRHNSRMAGIFGVSPRGAAGGRALRTSGAASPERAAKMAEMQAVRSQKAMQRAAEQRIRTESRLEKDLASQKLRQEKEYESAVKRGARERATAEKKSNRDSQAAYDRTMKKAGAYTKTLRGVATGAAATVGIAGGALFAAGLHESVQKSAVAMEVANQARAPKRKGEIARVMDSTRGFEEADVGQAMKGWLGITGDLDSILRLMPMLGEASLATGADLGELTSAAGDAFAKVADSVKDPIEQMEIMDDLVRSMAGMGAAGGIDIKQMAPLMGAVAASANLYGHDSKSRAQAVKGTFATAEIARQKGFAGDAAEAVTASSRFTDDMLAAAKKHKGKIGGVQMWQKGREGKELRSQEDIIADIYAKAGGKGGDVMTLFGARGRKFAGAFTALYEEGEKKEKGGGVKAIHAEYARLQGTQISKAEMAERANARMAEPDKELLEAMKKLRDEVGSALLPAFQKLVPELEKLAPLLGKVASAMADLFGWFVSHPIKGVGAVIALSVGKDVAEAGIGALIKKIITGSAAPVPPGVVPPGGGGIGASGTLATTAAVVGTALAVDQVSKLQTETGAKGKSIWGLLPDLALGAVGDVASMASGAMTGGKSGFMSATADSGIVQGAYSALGLARGVMDPNKGLDEAARARRKTADAAPAANFSPAIVGLTEAATKLSTSADKLAGAPSAPGRGEAPTAPRK